MFAASPVSGAVARSVSKAMDTPRIATRTPAVFRKVNGSLPSAAPTTMVSRGNVDNAREPRAAVVKIRDALKRIGNGPAPPTK
jgi:uncharacterized membrane protein YjjB (DUF3815 family)